ncbi:MULTISPECIES: sugar transferase [unclassified Sphingomonas]|uniref:sugar transferase n=1 Tax=unclassified Sphingomonas TaxID=196159 RepID=UPI000A8279DE|nr:MULTISPECIES: sugar transferase [unclassified Sphingomonas]
MSLFDVSRNSSWHSLRLQITGGLIAASVPFLIRLSGEGSEHIVIMTFVGCIIAVCIGTLTFRGISTYPGAEYSVYIVPSFAFSYGTLILFFVLGRFNYSIAVLFGSFISSVCWMYVVYFKIQRARDLRIGLVGETNSAYVEELSQVRWFPLADPLADVSELAAVAVDLRQDLPDEWERRLADYALSGLPVYHIKHLYESMTGRVELEQLSESSFGSLSPISAYMSLKHVIDWVLAALAIMVLIPAFLVVTVAIKLSSPGPALFRQRRIGYRGLPFIVYKFRTMKQATAAEADARNAAMTQSDDARITKLGKWLRMTRIDELPQLLNVLRGEMSWIGPRPEAEVLSQWYEEEIPFYRYRHIVRPGITGWAQVNQGHVAEISDVTSKLHYDFYYVKHFSPWIDLLIVARTVRTMVTGFGAR